MAIGLFDVHGGVGKAPDLEITSPLFDKSVLRFPSQDNKATTTTFEKQQKGKMLMIFTFRMSG